MGYQALLFCPDDKTARSVTQVLNELDFAVEPCTEPFAAVKRLMAQHFDAVVVDCDNEQNATLLFKSARNSNSNQSSLAVAVVEGQAGVAKAFRIGANLVLTKPINIEQAKGTLRVARGLLRKGGDSSKPTGPQPVAPAASIPAAAEPKAFGAAPQPLRPIVPSPAAKSPLPPAFPAKAPSATPPAAVAKAQNARVEASAQSDDAAPATKSVDAPAKPSASSAPKKNYPWQPAKPSAEPMASALRKAAEAAGVAETVDSKPSASVPPSLEKLNASTAFGAAAAPAPAREKVSEEVPLITPASQAERATPVLPKESAPIEEAASAVEPPSFSMGAPAFDEEEPASNKKALIIVGVVVLLASLAGYLGWKNMSSKSAPGSKPATTTEPAATGTAAPISEESKPAAPAPVETSKENTAQHAAAEAPAFSKPSPSTKPAAHEPAPSKQESSSEQPADDSAAPAFVVKNEQPRAAKKTAAEPDPAAAPSAIGVASGTDTNALAAISSAPVSVPKPSSDVVKVSQGVSEGLVLKRVAPRYPMQAIQLRKEGLVQLQATITKTGSITNLKVLTGDPTLAKAAVDAVRQWKYKPYYLDGEPVDIQTQISVNFKLPQ